MWYVRNYLTTIMNHRNRIYLENIFPDYVIREMTKTSYVIREFTKKIGRDSGSIPSFQTLFHAIVIQIS